MKVYLAGLSSFGTSYFREIVDECTAYAEAPEQGRPDNPLLDANVLESYCYMQKWQIPLIPFFKDFMLDSGAFTFMQKTRTVGDVMEYAEQYAYFVRDHFIDKYFELDIDSLVGYGTVLELRERIEGIVGWPCIPVWHKSRGADEFRRMCDEYDYVAAGGLVSSEMPYQYLPMLSREAHRRGAKIHMLGLSGLSTLKSTRCDSADSTAWLYGGKTGHIYRFTGAALEKQRAPEGMKLSPREASIHNMREYVKFTNWAEDNL